MAAHFRADVRGPEHLERRLHPHDRAAASSRRRRKSGARAAKPATSTRATTRAGTAPSTRSSSRRRSCVDGKCPTCGSKVERLKEESYYFRLSKYQQPLLDFYRGHPDFLQPEFRLNEVRTFVEAGLQDLSISRTSFQWGVPVPDDPKHVMYVWFDALTNYLTALGFGSDDDGDATDRCWPVDVTHLIGKEIVRQHALYWPAFLMSAGLPPPRRIIAHGWWLMGGAKMSKSLGNVARYQDYAAGLRVDALRYFVMREMPLGQDANFSDDGDARRGSTRISPTISATSSAGRRR